ncbi:glycosyltransferase family 2 protein [Mucilaginibacter sp. OK098]|uniref:glycosyltransferase family 2 protein n=1 Tax=Mucilaginibacter sp. OK098 TaxID=1855297 RepID=UPI000920E152|nr:glycosyltransferase family 2 protein [Mucilaginibacter sp. OK098]SHN24034.1 Glycosyl transferase family 2 [Mucilaginibacter sp. OK098]
MIADVDISIIIPTYNRLWSLPQTIESCRNNNCSVEIIVVDDGSTDGTWEWLDQQKDLVIIDQPNLGKCQAVNKGFKAANGKYIRFLDSDDLLNSNANDEQFQLAELNNADVVISGYRCFNNDGQTISKQPWIETDDFIAGQLGEGDGSHYSAFLFRKDFIQEIPHRPDFAFRDDRLFILEVALKDPKTVVHPGTALLHRVAHHDRLQISSGLKQQVQNEQHLNLYKIILEQLSKEGRLTPRRIGASINILWPLAHWIALNDLSAAVKLVKWIFELNPGFKPPEKGVLGLLYQKLGFANTEKLLRLRRKLLLR